MERDLDVQRMLDERAIERVLYRYTRGVDRLDAELLGTCFHEDATLVYGGETTPGAFIEGLIPGLSRYTLTQHAVCNVLIEVRGDRAISEAYCRAVHRIPAEGGAGEQDFLWGGRYADEFERRDGEWRISRRVCVHEWTSIVPVPATWPGAAAFTQGIRGPGDVSYVMAER